VRSKGTYGEFSKAIRQWDVCYDAAVRMGHVKMELFSPQGIVILELRNPYQMFDSLSYTVSTSFEGTESVLFHTIIFTRCHWASTWAWANAVQNALRRI